MTVRTERVWGRCFIFGDSEVEKAFKVSFDPGGIKNPSSVV